MLFTGLHQLCGKFTGQTTGKEGLMLLKEKEGADNDPSADQQEPGPCPSKLKINHES
jgi:hypothetical protein